MLHTAVALSVILGFASVEFLGLLSGGIVSAGYLAFYLEQPFRIVSTLALAVLVCLLVKLLQNFMIIYGRRRFMVTILLSIILSTVIEGSFIITSGIAQDLRMIGYIIPGLIANDMEKQGIFKTLAMVVIISLIIYLILHLGVLL
ncbi:MAG: poly-gamma-glutamate biosynthesis protein PgsC [Spirochaetes bacterium]|uniref:Poly-gamma-glutamate biosynthesis protein PgsC n=1 Tax=Candidatus Aphodenecus pullistercoris TaxID=2840669 RepID=A0A9D9H9E2_9SPIR|nr:poly-gamma-glutamate biosynthesis protein PgsC [Candidatus Aphodenecus pullistercoris]